MCHLRPWSGPVAFWLGLLLLVWDPPAPAAAGEPGLSVMTWNLYLGVDFSKVRREYRSIWTLPQSIDRLFGQVAENDFGLRVRALVSEVERRRPDVICLQEVALWRRASGRAFDPGDLGTPVVEQDFLKIVMIALARRDLGYRLAAVGVNEDVRVPSLRYGTIRLTDRNAILVADGVEVESGAAGWFKKQRQVRWLSFRFAFKRGWVQAVVKRGDRRIRIIDVHLALDWKIKRAQVEEVLAMVGASRLPVVVAGDFNLNPDRLSWLRRMLAKAGLQDAWRVAGKGPGGTCCQAKPLTRSRARLPARVDLVLATRDHFRIRSARRLGSDRTARVSFPDGKRRWISDHAGVVARLAFRRPGP